MRGYVLLLVAFAIAFYVLFTGSFDMDYAELFSGLFHTLLNTTFMLAGEFKTCNLSLDTALFTSHMTFMLFVCLVSIILLKFWNGLAVRDTEEIRKNAEMLSLLARLKFV